MSWHAHCKMPIEKSQILSSNAGCDPMFLSNFGKVTSPPWTSFTLFTNLMILDNHCMAPRLWTVNFQEAEDLLWDPGILLCT